MIDDAPEDPKGSQETPPASDRDAWIEVSRRLDEFRRQLEAVSDTVEALRRAYDRDVEVGEAMRKMIDLLTDHIQHCTVVHEHLLQAREP